MIGWIILVWCVLMLVLFCALAVIWLREEKQEDAEAYWADLKDPADDLAIHHINGDASNNEIENLALVRVGDYTTNYGRRMREDR